MALGSVWQLLRPVAEGWMQAVPVLLGPLVLICHLRPSIGLWELVLAGIPLGYTIASWLCFIACALYGSASPAVIRLVYAGLTLVALFYYARITSRGKSEAAMAPGALLRELLADKTLLVILAVSTAYFWSIFSHHLLSVDHYGNTFAGGSIWADLAFHLNVITSFLYGENKFFSLFAPQKSPIYAGEPMSYPFIPDFHAATLVATGSTMRGSLLLCSILISAAFLGLLYLLAKQFLSDLGRIQGVQLMSALAVVLWFFSGGIGGLTMLMDKDLTLSNIVNEDWMQKTSTGAELYWFSSISHVILPQRSAMFAYPLAVLVFICIYTGIRNEASLSRGEKTRMFAIAGVITGLIPLVHAHSFVAIGVVALTYCFLHPMKMFNMTSQGHFWSWMAFGLPIIALALPQMPIYLARVVDGDATGEGFIKFAPLWRGSPWNSFYTGSFSDVNAVFLWLRALGPMVPLSLLGWKYLNKEQRTIYASFIAVFIVGNLVMFQPWDKDNNKVFLVWLMAAAPVVALCLAKFWKSSVGGKLLVPILIVALVTSGVLICIREHNLHWQFMDQADMQLAEHVKATTKHDAIFITNDFHIHPITNLAGRTTVFGFAGWVHSHGYTGMWLRQQALRKYLTHPGTNIDFLIEHDVSYIVVDDQLGRDVPTLAKSWFEEEATVPLVFSNHKYRLYDLRGHVQAEKKRKRRLAPQAH